MLASSDRSLINVFHICMVLQLSPVKCPNGWEEKPLNSATIKYKVSPELLIAASSSSCPGCGEAAALGECRVLGMEMRGPDLSAS